MSTAALLMDLRRRGVRLEAEGDRLRFHPKSAVTPNLMAQLKVNKDELLAMLRPAVSVNARGRMPAQLSEESATTTCICGSANWRDVAIHASHSVRRDCAGCGRFLGFPLWYGKQY